MRAEPRRSSPAAALLGTSITIDRLDPRRIAVNSYPHDSDLPFGMVTVLRGPELLTHDATSFWRFRPNGVSAAAQELPLQETVDQLGWHGGVDAAGQALFFSAFSEIIILQRTGSGTTSCS